MTKALFELEAGELIEAYASRQASPVEVVRSVLERIAACEPTLNALWGHDGDEAIRQARASEARWLRREPFGLLDGVPVTLKENIATRGQPVPLGSAATALSRARDDGPPAARLREAGAVFLGKTTMPDYGMLSSGLSSFHSLARNPWNPALNPGGSSAGAAAATAAGYGPIHVGTDIGGSIRLPANWCGVVGLKPSAGRVPIQPPYVGRVAGPLTRSVADAARAMAVLSGADARDPTCLPWQEQAWMEASPAASRPFDGLRIGLLADAGWGLTPEPEVADTVAWAARLFESGGARVEPMRPFTTREMADGIDRFWRMRSWLDIGALPAERRERVLPFILEWVAPAATYSATQVFLGFSQIAALRDATLAACSPFDAVLSPTAPNLPFPAEWAMPTNDPARAMEHIGFTLPFNMSEQPAITVPCATARNGMPIGVQIAAPRHADLALLRIARWFELLRGPVPTLAPFPPPAP